MLKFANQKIGELKNYFSSKAFLLCSDFLQSQIQLIWGQNTCLRLEKIFAENEELYFDLLYDFD